MNNFLANHKVDLILGSTANGTSTINGGTVDMQGWDGVVFIGTFQTAAAGNIMKAQQGNASNMSDAADLEGSGVSSGTSDEGVILDIYRPRERYVRPTFVRGTSTVLGEVWAIRYRGRSMPTTNSVSGTQASKALASPAEGTA